MYRHNEKQLVLEFELPFGGRLSPDNRWVKLGHLIPWDEFENEYHGKLTQSGQGPPAISARMALATLIIKERLQVSDRECVEQIRENPYLQYFCGMKAFSEEPPFNPSMLVHFRKRFTADIISRINESVTKRALRSAASSKEKADDDDNKKGGGPSNRGKLLVDATCAPADISFPTDLKLINNARERSEHMIDIFHSTRHPGSIKPRTYRKKARKEYLSASKSKRMSTSKRRQILRLQLGYLNRNLGYIDALSKEVGLQVLKPKVYKDLLVITELYRQQKMMFDRREKRIDDRIININQPHVRPIKRGKAGRDTEFGAKLSVSLVDGYAFVDRISWDNFNENQDLVRQIERYKKRFGVYPKSVHVDQIYRTRDNRKYCKRHGIRISGPPLGRPPKRTAETEAELIKKSLQARQDEIDRIPIEGKFGQAKRRYCLGRVMTKLAKTSETAISLCFLVMNLEKWLKAILLCLFFKEPIRWWPFRVSRFASAAD
ncbi:IS5 family transposase [Desulfoluna spongiiphila]|uniref:IS5 family transposase n=5 Tax=Desulfoluna spongiiphila TaxID=419481 RepID=UPI001250EB46|nr:IS5 family transposase [Desulfoluna spongiiphila]VVS94181.1 consensus disorder prediction [Desulfoluna spongiiphila]VVS95360.1 consensus disorder prediction [Desulfoluna spongiiphila]VVS95533.1 consensus disorder prediction [Desulfoluna spongiiphila]